MASLGTLKHVGRCEGSRQPQVVLYSLHSLWQLMTCTCKDLGSTMGCVQPV